jgi:hypothetical protein
MGPPPGASSFSPSPPYAQSTGSRWKAPNLKWWATRAVVVLVVLLVYGGFRSATADARDPYSHKNQQAFVHGCTKSGGTSEATCWCMIGWIKQNVAVADFKAFGHLVTSAGYTHAQDPPWLGQAIQACVGLP